MENSIDVFGLMDEARKAGFSDEQIYNKVSFFLEQKARENATPYRGSFELTPLCNLNCKMCYVHLNETQMQGRKLLPVQVWIDLMSQAIEFGMSKAILTGGECLMYPEFNTVYLFLKSKGILVTVKTNGVLLDSDRIDFFKTYPPRRILVSLYGHSDEVYEKVTGKRLFFRVIENIKLAIEEKLPISIMITPNSYMGDSVKETIRLAKDLGIPYFINSTLMTPRPDTQKEKEKYDITLDQYIDILLYNATLNNKVPRACNAIPIESGNEAQYELRGIQCGAGKSGFSIRWDGIMYPCISMDSISGNPIETGFYSAWMNINRAINSFPAFTKCDTCTYSRNCTYCAAENEKLGSKFLLNSLWCERTWRMVKSGLISINGRCEEA